MSPPTPKRKPKTRHSGGKREVGDSLETNQQVVKYVRNKSKLAGEKNTIRKSLFDIEREKMNARGFVMFMQRVYIFLKNPPTTQSPYNNEHHSSEEGTEVEKMGSEESEDEKEHQQPLVAFNQKKDPEQMLLYRLVGKALEETLRKRLEEIVEYCNRSSLTEDKLTGAFIFMGNYSLIIIESTEEAMDIFCREFNKRFCDFWANNKIFLVEDNIAKNYFGKFICKSVPPIHINQKFPPKQADDELIMGEQHQQIKRKLQALCKSFLIDFGQEEKDVSSLDDTADDNKSFKADPHLELLAKHVPEVQRIDLILLGHRFYRNIKDFGKTFFNVPMNLEDEEMCWPVRSNYTPYGVYQHSEFDFNLTYPESNATSEEKTKQSIKDGGDEDVVEDGEGEKEGGEAAA